MRDMGFTMSRDGGKTFAPLTRVNQDGWSIQGCPDDGPAMAVDAKGTVHLVWPTVQNEQGVILYATSKNGAAFSTPVRVPTLGGPKPSHPQVAVDRSGRVFVAWDEVRDGVRRAAIRPIGGSKSPDSPRRGDIVSGDGADRRRPRRRVDLRAARSINDRRARHTVKSSGEGLS